MSNTDINYKLNDCHPNHLVGLGGSFFCNITFLFIFVFIALFSPLIALSLCVALSMTKSNVNLWDVRALVISVSSLMAALNVVKVPESDMAVYLEMFSTLKELGFNQYYEELLYGREPAYHVFMHSIISLAGNQTVHIYAFTFFVYLLYLMALVGIGKLLSIKSSAMVFLVLCVGFFHPIFSVSFHLNRQVLALVFLVLGLWIFLKGRFFYCLVFGLLAVMSHVSAAIFFGLAVPAYFIAQKTSWFRMFMICVSMLFVLSAQKAVGVLLMQLDVSILSYLGQRAAQTVYFELNRLGYSPEAFLIAIFLFCLLMLKRCDSPQVSGSGLTRFNVRFIISLNLLLVVYIFVAGVLTGHTELATRFFTYVYAFLPFLLIFGIKIFPGLIKFLPVLAISTSIAFILSLWFGVWSYEDTAVTVLYFPSAW